MKLVTRLQAAAQPPISLVSLVLGFILHLWLGRRWMFTADLTPPEARHISGLAMGESCQLHCLMMLPYPGCR